MQDRSAAVGRAAFVCPHCRAFTQQKWFKLRAAPEKEPPPYLDPERMRQFIKKARDKDQLESDEPEPERVQRWLTATEEGRPGLNDKWNDDGGIDLVNARLTECFVCKKEALWVGPAIVFPAASADVAPPNEDLPGDIRRDYDEAGRVVALSPRAAAALLRLAIQKLCSFLLGRDGGINEMIADLVKQGLSPKVQRALDVVRVVGNEAVHPGTIDLRDDQATAMQLFALVNLIAEAMISQPKHVADLYGSLPPDKVAAIEARDGKK